MGHMIGSTFDDTSGTIGTDGDLALIDTTRAANGDVLNRSGAPLMWIGGPTSTTSTTVNSVDKWTFNRTHVCYSGKNRGTQYGTTVDEDGNGGYNVEDENYTYKAPDGRVATQVVLATKGWGKCPERGDSGAPVYINTPGVGVAAHGIVSASKGRRQRRFRGQVRAGPLRTCVHRDRSGLRSLERPCGDLLVDSPSNGTMRVGR